MLYLGINDAFVCFVKLDIDRHPIFSTLNLQIVNMSQDVFVASVENSGYHFVGRSRSETARGKTTGSLSNI